MSTVDLMLLGALMEKPMNAYEMKKNMETRNINAWVKISSPSIYKNLVILNKKGYLDDEIVKEGEMPEKTIYAINEKGRNYFLNIMDKYSEKPEKIYIDFVAFVANLRNVEPKMGLEMIQNLRNNLSISRDNYLDNIDYQTNESNQVTHLVLYEHEYYDFPNLNRDLSFLSGFQHLTSLEVNIRQELDYSVLDQLPLLESLTISATKFPKAVSLFL